jgi:hypothetical protein
LDERATPGEKEEMNAFVKFTGWNGNPFYVRKDLIAAVHTYNGKTCLVLTMDEVDYEIKETPEQALKIISGEQNDNSTARGHIARPRTQGVRKNRRENNQS